MDEFTLSSLATIAGVTVAAGIITQVVKLLFDNLSAVSIRRVALLSGIVLYVAAGFAVGVDPALNTFAAVLLFLLNGSIAGLAASAVYDTARFGEDRTTTKTETP